MTKISSGERNQYREKIKPFQLVIERNLSQEQRVLEELKGNSPSAAAFKRLDLVRDMLNLASNYIVLNSMSLSMLNMRNEEALNEGRKSLYKGLIYLEEIVGKLVDAPFSDYEDRLANIGGLDEEHRYLLIRRMGLAIQLLEDACGDNTRWRWVFVELEGRFAAAAKNILDMKAAFSNTDPRSPEYEPTVRHVWLVSKLLMRAADRYRDRYELSTNHIDDFKQGIQFLAALKRFHSIMGEQDRVELVRKKLETWSAKLEGDLKKQEEVSLKKDGNA